MSVRRLPEGVQLEVAFGDATSARSAAAFDNPDHVAIVIHNYRWRIGLAEVSRNMTIWKSGLPKVRSSPCRPSRLKVMPTAHRIRNPVPTRRNSQADMSTGPLRAASDTICRRKHRTLLPKRSSTSPKLKSLHRSGSRPCFGTEGIGLFRVLRHDPGCHLFQAAISLRKR